MDRTVGGERQRTQTTTRGILGGSFGRGRRHRGNSSTRWGHLPLPPRLTPRPRHSLFAILGTFFEPLLPALTRLARRAALHRRDRPKRSRPKRGDKAGNPR